MVYNYKSVVDTLCQCFQTLIPVRTLTDLVAEVKGMVGGEKFLVVGWLCFDAADPSGTVLTGPKRKDFVSVLRSH